MRTQPGPEMLHAHRLLLDPKLFSQRGQPRALLFDRLELCVVEIVAQHVGVLEQLIVGTVHLALDTMVGHCLAQDLDLALGETAEL